MRWLYKCYLMDCWPFRGIMPGKHSSWKPWMDLWWPMCPPPQPFVTLDWVYRKTFSFQATNGRLWTAWSRRSQRCCGKKVRPNCSLTVAVIFRNSFQMFSTSHCKVWNQSWERKWENQGVAANSYMVRVFQSYTQWHNCSQECQYIIVELYYKTEIVS